mgnify:CR=1 FL=1
MKKPRKKKPARCRICKGAATTKTPEGPLCSACFGAVYSGR